MRGTFVLVAALAVALVGCGLRPAKAETEMSPTAFRNQAWAKGLANLSARMGRPEIGPFGEIAGLIAISADSGPAPSVLLLPEACTPRTNGRLARHFFVQPANDDERAIAVFWRLARFQATSPEAFSRSVIACREGRWAVVEAPTG